MEFQDQKTHPVPQEHEGAAYSRSRPPASYDRGVQIAAARLRVVCDEGLGQETPEWIRILAAEKLAGDY